MIKAIFFDLDGTLLDTLPDICACVNEVLAAHGHPPVTQEQTRDYVGDGARQLIERALPAGAADVDVCYEDFRTRFRASKNERTRLYPGEREALARFRARGLLLGVVTNKPQDAAERVLKQFFSQDCFAFIGGDTGMFPCKPDPSLARYAALTLRLAPAECVFVGDGETDARVAVNAGMCGVSALWGYRTRSGLEAAGAVRFADSYAALEKIVLQLIENY